MAQYKISNEKYGETTYFTDKDALISGMDALLCQWANEKCEENETEFADEYKKQRDELEEAIEELDTDNIRIIMDNAGGYILQLGEWAHYYNGMEYRVARDIAAWIENRETTDWEGHEIEALDIDTDTPYGYTVIEIGDDDSVRSLVREMLEHSKWDRLATAMMAHLD